MKIGDRQFRPTPPAIALTVVGVVVFVALGYWQLERAAYKQTIQQKFEQRLIEPYREFRAGESLADIEYRRLLVDGRFDNSRNLLVDNKVHRGQAGYHVLTPLHLNDSDAVLLVDRGWVAWGASRTPLPSIPAATSDSMVAGIAHFPSQPVLRLGGLQTSEQWPQLIGYIDIDALQGQFPEPLLPMILWMAPAQVDGFVREWQPVWMSPAKSRAYATQWFSFAVIALIFFVVLNFRKLK